MPEPKYTIGELYSPNSNDPDDDRVVSFRFIEDMTAGELNVQSGNPLNVGDTYVLAQGSSDTNIVIGNKTRRREPGDDPWYAWTEYLFSVVP